MMLNSKSIGNKIAEARKKINLSQAEVAQLVSISSQAVGKWERGESLPDITTIMRLAKIFGVDLNYFAEGAQPNVQETQKKISVAPPASANSTKKQRKTFGLNWNMSSGNWVGADFSGLNNVKNKFNSSNMKNCKFIGSDLSELWLESNDIKNCDFSNSDLRNCKIQSSELLNNNFSACSMIDAQFISSDIVNCNFSSVNFSGVEFNKVNFEKINTEDATWKLASFKLSHISNVILNGLIEDCSFDNCSYSKLTFKNAKIINTFFKGNKLKGINFIDCEADRLTYEFLKNGKADLTGLQVIS